jgi:peptidoglycan/xylan/chitin deacetylase (PgdA/CDA1 family)
MKHFARSIAGILVMVLLLALNQQLGVQSIAANILQNPSLETLNPLGNNPQYWQRQSAGNNEPDFSLTKTGGHTGNVSARVEVSTYSDGEARWQPNWTAVLSGIQYTYSVWYKSSTATNLRVQIRKPRNVIEVLNLGTVSASAVWKQYSTTLSLPIGTLSIGPTLSLSNNGWLEIDDASISEGVAVSSSSSSSSTSSSSSVSSVSSSSSQSSSSNVSNSSSQSSSSVSSSASSSSSSSTPRPVDGWNRAIVSIDFDDNLVGSYTYGLPLLKQYGYKSTQYVVKDWVGDTESGYMTVNQLKDWKNQGMVIGSHSVDHARLTNLTAGQIDLELKNSKAYLDTTFNQNTTDFVTPYCASNQAIAAAAQKYYQFSRDCGYNFVTPSNIVPYHLNAKGMLRSYDFAEFKTAVDTAIANNWWLILIFHDVGYDDSNEYSHSPAQFESYLQYLKQKKVTVLPSGQAYQEVKNQ